VCLRDVTTGLLRPATIAEARRIHRPVQRPYWVRVRIPWPAGDGLARLNEKQKEALRQCAEKEGRRIARGSSRARRDLRPCTAVTWTRSLLVP
jgi:hypothetical protein